MFRERFFQMSRDRLGELLAPGLVSRKKQLSGELDQLSLESLSYLCFFLNAKQDRTGF